MNLGNEKSFGVGLKRKENKMADPHEQAERERRAPALQAFLDALAEKAGIEQEFIDSSAHPYSCKCLKCLNWWAKMGPDGEPDDKYAFGPFARREVEDYCTANDIQVWW